MDNLDSGPIIRTVPVDIDDATRKPCCVHQDDQEGRVVVAAPTACVMTRHRYIGCDASCSGRS